MLNTSCSKKLLPHGGDIRSEALIYGLKPDRINDFSVNINPLTHPGYLRNLLLDNIQSILSYPDSDASLLKEAVSDYLVVPSESILIGNGSIELIFNIVRCYDIKSALIFGPAFSEYERAVILNKGKTRYLFSDEKNDFRFDFKNIKTFKDFDAVFILNPNNPTGAVAKKGDIALFLKRSSSRTIFIIDEVFMDFLEDTGDYSLIGEVDKFKNLIVIRSLTKFFSIPGLRVGYVVANKRIIKRLQRLKIPWSVNNFAQIIGERLMRDKEFIKKSRMFIKKEASFLFKHLSEIKSIRPYFPGANFILCRIKNKDFDSNLLKDALMKKGILIRDCSNFKGLNNRFFRVAIKNRLNNIILLKELRRVFHE